MGCRHRLILCADATGVEPYLTTLATDPRFSVAYEQLAASPDALTSSGPVVGPLREIRSVLATANAAPSSTAPTCKQHSMRPPSKPAA